MDCLPERYPHPIRLLISDMDSTMIEQECIDELAGNFGLKEQVAAITEAAMRGELDFKSALRERVALLQNLPVEKLESTYQERVTPSPGAEALVRGMAERGATCVLVSGGFTFFTERVAARLGFHHHHANQLEIADGKLTGKVVEPILDKEDKLARLQNYQQKLGIGPDNILALGDGANDLPMLQAAGFGVAYRAKPNVKAAIPYHLDDAPLDTLLAILPER